MGDEKNMISLKDASIISGYSADYIGQLIRAGKIPGKQVYSNITWMTTKEAVLEYKANSRLGDTEKKNLKKTLQTKSRLIGMELNIIKLFFKTFKSALPVLVVLLVSFLLLSSYIIYLLFGNNSTTGTLQVLPESAISY
jgi:hypothetical protein